MDERFGNGVKSITNFIQENNQIIWMFYYFVLWFLSFEINVFSEKVITILLNQLQTTWKIDQVNKSSDREREQW